MPSPDWSRIRDSFHDAMAREPAQRAALLRELAATDEALARELASLLAAHDAVPRDFLDAPAELAAASRLGAFEILAKVGQGGMGDVYKARDTRLGRIVALKLLRARPGLPEYVPEGRARERFEQEARAISRLTHPHICTLYDVGAAPLAPGGPELPFLVMEFLEGRTLAERLGEGPIDPAEALDHALAITDALAAAHARGIVHRDLKPGNIMLTANGVKLMDFGLAEFGASDAPVDDGGWAAGTRSSLWMRGPAAGTLRYMSPEQLRGQPVDARSDVFACGIVLHEMLTGRSPFDAPDDASVIAAILAAPLPSLDVDDSPLARRLARIVSRCLARPIEERWARMDDLRAALVDARDGRDVTLIPGPAPAATSPNASGPARAAGSERGRWPFPWRGRRPRPGPAIAVAALAAAAVVAAVSMLSLIARQPALPAAAPQGMTRLSIVPPDGVRFDIFQISPDGRSLAFTGWSPQGSRVWLRALDSNVAQPVTGTDGAQGPVFWSPDSRFLAFVVKGSLVAYDTVNQTTRRICDVNHPLSATWGADGMILFDTPKDSRDGLMRVTAGGGQPVRIPPPDAAGRDGVPLFPHFLPDGRRYLFSVSSADPGRAGVYFVDPASGRPPSRLLGSPSPVQYVQSGHLLFIQENAIVAQRFDLEAGALYGAASPIVRADHLVDRRHQMRTPFANLSPFFAASQTGIVVLAANPLPLDQLAWYDRAGTRQQSVGEPAPYAGFALSPDETRVVATLGTGQSERRSLWTLDMTRGISSRLTFGRISHYDPRWSPDGRRIAVSASVGSAGEPAKSLAAIALDGREATVYAENGHNLSLDDWSPDGRVLLYHSDRDRELRAVPIGDAKTGKAARASTLVWRSPSAFAPDQGRFSPDGRLIAYNAQDSGRVEVYVTRYPDSGERWQVSSAGGVQPMWRGDSGELYYLGLDGSLFAVPMGPAGRVQPGVPRLLFHTPITPSTLAEQYAADKTGARFLLLEPDPRAPAPLIDLVMNWSAATAARR